MIIKPFLYDEPLSPIKCSVERFVSNIEPAITTPVRLLPPKKNPSFDLRFSFLSFFQEYIATNKV